MATIEFMGIEFQTVYEPDFEFTAVARDRREVSRETVENFEYRIQLVDELAQVAWLMLQQERYGREWNALCAYINRIEASAFCVYVDITGSIVTLDCVKNKARHKHVKVVAKNAIVGRDWRDSHYWCGECNTFHPLPPDGSTIMWYRNHRVCPDCAKNFITCPNCGRLHKSIESREIWVHQEDGTWASHIFCDRCTSVDGEQVFYCDIHQRYEAGNETRYSGFGWGCEWGASDLERHVCSLCGHEHWAVVRGRVNKVTVFGTTFEPLCGTCYRRLMDTARIADEDCRFSYGFKPMTVFFDDDGTPRFQDDGSLHMGFELELDGASDGEDCDYFANEVHAHYDGFIYCKSDCSLDVGAESVSQPATPKYLLDSFDWGSLLSSAEEYCLDNSSENCGFHVHMNRKFFEQGDGEELNIAKLTILFDRFYDKFKKIGQRYDSQADEWARPSYDPLTTSDFENERYKRKLDANKRTRYHAVNTCNEHTVEIRLFSASTSVVRLKFMLDVLQAVANAVIELSVMDCLTMDEDNLNAQIINHSIYEQTSRLL